MRAHATDSINGYDRQSVAAFFREVWGALAHARLPLVAAALALHVAGLLITGERWRLVIAALGTRLSLWRVTLINLAGIFVRNATPTTGLGGDASRIALLRADGVPLAAAAAAFGFVRLAELPALALIVALAAPALAAAVRRSATAIAVAAVLATALAALSWVKRDRVRAAIGDAWARTAHLRIRWPAMLAAVGYATLAQAETVARQIVVAAAFGMPLTVQQSATVIALSVVGGLAPTIGSLGAVEGGIAAGLMLFGASAHTAVAITIVERAISYGISTVAGAAALAVLGGRRILRAVNERRMNTAIAD